MMEMIELTVKDAVLQALEQARGTRLSGGRLAEQLGVSRAAVHKAIAALRESGLAIDAVTGEGYRLASDDDSLTAAGINALLDTAVIGREILVEPSLTSSNTTMKEQYLGRRHGFTLFAEEQTGGRGRLGRTFVSPADTGVYMTILLHPTLPLSHLSFVTISAAIAVVRAIEQTAGFTPQIKWVNDVLMNGRKLCGILTEATIEGETGTVSSLVVGIGINLHPDPAWPRGGTDGRGCHQRLRQAAPQSRTGSRCPQPLRGRVRVARSGQGTRAARAVPRTALLHRSSGDGQQSGRPLRSRVCRTGREGASAGENRGRTGKCPVLGRDQHPTVNRILYIIYKEIFLCFKPLQA